MKVCVTRGSLVGLMVLIAACLIAPQADAEESPPRVFVSSFGGGHLDLIGQSNLVDQRGQSGVGVDQEGGEVYIADTGHGRVVRYSPSGTSEATFATLAEPTFLAVDNSAGGSGDVYVVSNGRERITKLDPAGAPVSSWGTGGSLEGFGEIDGIAVDGSGYLFVLAGTSEAELYKLGPGGTKSNECVVPYTSGGDEAAPNGIALDTAGNLYFLRAQELVPTFRFLQGVVKTTTGCGNVPGGVEFAVPTGYFGVAVEESDGSVFLTGGEEVQHWAGSGEEPIGTFGPGEGALEHASQLVVGSVNDAIYVADPGKQYVAIFEPEIVEPPSIIFKSPEGVTNVTGNSADFEAEINPNGHGTTYEFHCIPECSGTGLKGTLAAGTAFETVEATAEGLKPGTEYVVYVEAKNAGGRSRVPAEGGLPFTTEAVAPTIEGEFVSAASETEAALGATLNPGGAQTAYMVQYVTRAQYEASEFTKAGAAGEQSANGAKAVQITTPIAGLSPGTPYVARIVATNRKGSAESGAVEFTTQEPSPALDGCPNAALRSGPSALLPDCRAYEQSTPVDKNGGGVGGVPGAVQALEGPDAITYYSQAGLPGGVGAQDYPSFISSREGEAWGTRGLLPPQSVGRKAFYLGLTPGGRFAISAAKGADSGFGLFRRNLQSGAMATIVGYEPECGERCLYFVGASTDGSRIVFESTLPLTGQTPAGQRNVFEWIEGAGTFLVDVDAAGEPLPEGGFAGPYNWYEEDLNRGGSGEYFYAAAAGAVSADGGQVIFTEAGEAEGHGSLYLRSGIGTPSASTVEVSADQGGAGPVLPAAFLEATPKGGAATRGIEYVFFKSKAALTADAYAGEAGEESESLYRYDVATGQLLDLTPDPGEELASGPGVEGMLGAAESGAVAYFTARAVLSTEPGPTGETAVAGQANLYRWQQGRPLEFIARLKGEPLNSTYAGAGDSRDWSPAMIEKPGYESPLEKTARVSADGSSVVFSSHRALTGAPNVAASCAAGTGVGKQSYECAEFFRYAVGQELTCLSCDPTGASPISGATIGTAYIAAVDYPGEKAAPTLARNLSTNENGEGTRFFFQTPDPLVAADHNGPGCQVKGPEQASCLDVYEWEAPGTGTCTAATAGESGGCVSLISSGTSDQASYFADADRSGKNAYFFTASELVPADGDQLYDVYDARELGGLASQHPVTPQRCGSREECQGAQASPGPAGNPATPTFVGSGNPKPKANRGCTKAGSQAKALSRRAKALRRNARKVARHDAARARRMRDKAGRLATRAKKKSQQAKTCRAGGTKKKASTRHTRRHTGHDRRAAR